VGSINVAAAGYTHPDGVELFRDITFKVGAGELVALIGVNGTGKSTLFDLIAGVRKPTSGSVRVDGHLAVMPQAVGRIAEGMRLRELLVRASSTALRAAGLKLIEAELKAAHGEDVDAGMAVAEAVDRWGNLGGWQEEAVWDASCQRVLRQPFTDVSERFVHTLSGGERKQLLLDTLLRNDADVLLLDEPDNFLDIPAKKSLEKAMRDSEKTILVISHDRELLSAVSKKTVTLEGHGAWVHTGPFTDYVEARNSRNDAMAGVLDRWEDEERRLFRIFKMMKTRAASSDKNAAAARAAETRWKKFVAAGAPPAPPGEQKLDLRLTGAESGTQLLVCTKLEIAGLTEPFDLEVAAGERIAVVGPNGSGKSHFIRLLGGGDVEFAGTFQLGARVVAGLFSQTNERAEFDGKTPLDICKRRLGAPEAARAALGRYGLAQTAENDIDTLSGGQLARLQILDLELSGVNLLLLDEPTDNLDIDSAEALQAALDRFRGTVMSVSHDRWFLRTFDRFVVFDFDCTVGEALDFDVALEALENPSGPKPARLRPLTSAS
jgi:ATPase subunit of ABC transporter with duplicated ATPase domains